MNILDNVKDFHIVTAAEVLEDGLNSAPLHVFEID